MDVIFRPKDGCQDRFEIIVNGGIWREVHQTIFGRHPVFPPVSCQNDLQDIFDAFEYRRVKAYLLWRLSRQSYHSEQLVKALQERLVQSHTIGRVIDEFRDMGALDDEVWLQNFMQVQQKRYGLRHILNKLYGKGISQEVIQHVASKWENANEEVEAIERLIETRHRLKDLSDYKTRQKVMASLARKGYGFENIQEVINRKLGK